MTPIICHWFISSVEFVTEFSPFFQQMSSCLIWSISFKNFANFVNQWWNPIPRLGWSCRCSSCWSLCYAFLLICFCKFYYRESSQKWACHSRVSRQIYNPSQNNFKQDARRWFAYHLNTMILYVYTINDMILIEILIQNQLKPSSNIVSKPMLRTLKQKINQVKTSKNLNYVSE